jgi:hypothetical protein
MTTSRKIAAPLTILLLCAVAWLGARAWGHSSATTDAAPPERLAAADVETVDIEPRQIARIEPGAKIEEGPPEGWSHLVLHAVPRVAEGDVETVSALVNRLVSKFHLTILADVAPTDGPAKRFRLDRVAIGLALPINDIETVITPSTQEKLGAKLGFVDRNALSESEGSLNGVKQVARTSTMLVFDAPSIMRLDKKNRSVTQRHAVLTSPTTGKLATLVWIVDQDEDGAPKLVDNVAHLLPENCEDDRQIFVDAEQFSFGIPSKQAFALVKLPDGDDIPIDANWRTLAAGVFKDSTDVVKLEQALRAALGWNKEVTRR